MKTVIISIFLTIYVHSNAQILNPGFENGLNDWSSSYGMPWVAKDTSESYSGNNAVFLTHKMVCGIAPGNLINGSEAMPGNPITAGTPIAGKPNRLKGYYKYQESFSTDSALATVYLKKLNPANNTIDTVGMGETILGSSDYYTCFTVDIIDLMPGIMPDSIVILFQVSKNINLIFDSTNWTNPVFSALFLDDVSISDEVSSSDFKADFTYQPINECFTYQPINECLSSSDILFSNTSISNNCNEIEFFEWNFGDPFSGNNNISTLKNPKHDFSNPGEFQITLIVSNTTGIRDTFINTIVVNDIPAAKIFLPSSFTPNGDGLNEVFFALGEEVTFFELKIFNKWGELLFKTNEISEGWDGSYESRAVQSDIFIWKVAYKNSCSGNETISKEGYVFLAR